MQENMNILRCRKRKSISKGTIESIKVFVGCSGRKF